MPTAGQAANDARSPSHWPQGVIEDVGALIDLKMRHAVRVVFLSTPTKLPGLR